MAPTSLRGLTETLRDCVGASAALPTGETMGKPARKPVGMPTGRPRAASQARPSRSANWVAASSVLKWGSNRNTRSWVALPWPLRMDTEARNRPSASGLQNGEMRNFPMSRE